MRKQFKIPTIIALSLLLIITLLIFSIYFYIKSQTSQTEVNISQLNIVNITDRSASLSFITETVEKPEVIISTSNLEGVLNLEDTTQKQLGKNSKLHLIDFANLTPNTKYYTKAKIKGKYYPQKSLEFVTGPEIIDAQINRPLSANIIDDDFKPAEESLIFFKTQNSNMLATKSNKNGSFLIPLANLRTEDLKEILQINGSNPLNIKTDAELKITNGIKESTIQINLPVDNSSIPPLVLGQDLDLRSFLNGSKSQTFSSNKPTISDGKFDLNNDGKVNALDMAQVFDNYGKIIKDKKTDFNDDGVVDDKDLELIKKVLE